MAGQDQEMTVESMRQLASSYRANAAKAADISSFLDSQNHSMYWQSEASASFKSSINKYITTLNFFNDTFKRLAQEVDTRAQITQENQSARNIG